MTKQSNRANATPETAAIVDALQAPKMSAQSRGFILEAIKSAHAADKAGEKAGKQWLRAADALHGDGITSDMLKEKKGSVVEEFKLVVYSGMAQSVQVAIALPSDARTDSQKEQVKNAQSVASVMKSRCVAYLQRLESELAEAQARAAGASEAEIQEAQEQDALEKACTALLKGITSCVDRCQRLEDAPFDITAVVANLNKALALVAAGGK